MIQRLRALAAVGFAMGLLVAGGEAAWGEPGAAAALTVPPGIPAGDGAEISDQTAGDPVPQTGDPVGEAVRRAWSEPAATLDQRVDRARRAALEFGMLELEGPARALLLTEAAGTPLERARAATKLAPQLPAARAALAGRLLAEGHVLDAIGQLVAGVAAVPGHLEARLWTEATLSAVLALAAVLAGLLFLVVSGGSLIPPLMRALSLHGLLPTASRFAAASALLLLPAALGEGIVGVALALTCLGFCYGSVWRRACVGIGAALLVVGLYPLADRAAQARFAAAVDPLVLVAHTAEYGFPTRAEVQRLAAAPSSDLIASRALALRAKREGALDAADAQYSRLLGRQAEPGLMNNAANVRLAMGRTDEAIELYEVAARRSRSPVVLFNLSQAYGSAIRLDEQDLALAEAQGIDPDRVADLVGVFARSTPSHMLDVPVPASTLLGRLDLGAAPEPLAESFRRRVAPGRLGDSPTLAALAFVGVALLGLTTGLVLSRVGGGDEDLYAGIARLLQAKASDPAERMVRLAELRDNQSRIEKIELAISALVPGAAGVLARRPLLGLLGSVIFGLGLAFFLHRGGVAPDPLAIGQLGSLVMPLLLFGLGLAHVAVIVVSIALREKA